ncbi:ribonuclease T1, variant [Neurospora crassa OR74A]|uniref:Guanyl-specific ribonuclease N1 n=1 Tax=Neurospora crassa (strain ATCC 24698 / 74-OR23-1A / CBS 708.71 / DSM 1257 / FGSC 987) TaxID=367110 RepID=RNN1_NEUCR|nr:ribonuclease T1, variant [Neurospora crassa OR74A]P09646.2 RecName: Full=Guanyl-specific ribonuclease N1; Short=RNase N1; Flags: Precursor [Neurospora crassa OR74A]ESA42488.1 ribonuclease T1, variant [Neurospora crassa OR74A]CAD21301.1 ribonuclease T1 [Neurospora crassa]|eukprot:XP_011394457.1 ribonuclease T1, variant [Neurospora crassa OR74A]
MVQLLSAFVSLLSVVAVSGAAIPAPAPEAVVDVAPETATIEPTGNFTAQACMYICGSVCYSSSAISAALNKGYSYYEDGATAGSSSYPHRYNNYEGFDFPTAKPWYEFPILSSGRVYTGGSPGADRVIFDSHGNLDMLITHNGASGNNFVACN